MQTFDEAFAAVLRIARPLTRALLAQIPESVARPNDETIREPYLLLRPGNVIGVGVIDDSGARTLFEGPAQFESFEVFQLIQTLQKACAFFVNEAAAECDEGDDFFPGSAVYIAPDANTIEVRYEKGNVSRPLCFWMATPAAPSLH